MKVETSVGTGVGMDVGTNVSVGRWAGRWIWTTYWQAMRKYHRFALQPHGLDHILGCSGPAMIVGYHGKPGARDLVMLQTLLLLEYGERTHAITHDMVFRVPGLRALAEGMQLVGRDRESIDRVVQRGEKLVVTPGGIEEAWAPFRDRYRVQWRHLGYLRLAIRHQLPIILVAGVGADDAFYPVYDAYQFWRRFWQPPSGQSHGRSRWRLPEGAGLWLGLGPLGLWPFSPPFPTSIVQYIDPPFHLADHGINDPDDRPRLEGVHHHLVARVQRLLDDGRAKAKGRSIPAEELTWVDQTKS